MSVTVGVGVIIVNQQGEVLMGKRCSQHAPYWSIPGVIWRRESPLSKQLDAKFLKKQV